MSHSFSSRFSVTPVWRIIRDIRLEVQEAVESEIPHLMEPVAMVASELLENAVKYGVGQIAFHFDLDAEMIRITVSNRIGHDEDADNVFQTLELLENNEPFNLYTERLTQLMEGAATTRCQLGLLRVVCEGGFTLVAKREEQQLIVTATLPRSAEPVEVPEVHDA